MMSFVSFLKMTLLSFCLWVTAVNAFVITPLIHHHHHHHATKTKPSTTTLFLEDWIADMIDQEIYHQAHKKEYENAWMEKNRAAVFAKMESDFMYREDTSDFVMHQKDTKLAKNDPQKYCADRCIATGNCDIYEDL